ncbi:MAG: outer membrane protein transport protein [Bacteroidota bacterium]
MKKYLSFIMLMVCAGISAQGINDVLRYGQEGTQGTARYQAMAGAFGALGGDMSALNSNPAGSAVFNNSLMTLTGTYYHRDNEAAYFDRVSGTDLNTTDLNQFGGVFVFKNTDSDSGWKKVSLALNYDMARNFDNQVYVSGNSSQGIDNYFSNFAQGVPLDVILPFEGEFLEEAYQAIGNTPTGFVDQQAFLGYHSGILVADDEDDLNNTAYSSIADYGTVNQDYVRNTSGFNSKFVFNLGTQYGDNLYFGASANFHSVLYEELTTLDERGFSTNSDIQFINFDNLVRTEGWGFSYSLGAILKLNENMRLGGSYQSKTWYKLRDDLSQRINTDSPLVDPDIDFINLNLVTVFDEYTIEIPEKFTGSAAIIFGKDGLLSFDYTYQDMSQAELLPNRDPDFASENAFISRTLRPVSTFRAGGEFRIDRLSLRAGYRLEQSPYEDPDLASDLTGYSGGLGYSFGNTRLDLAVTRTDQEVSEQLYSTGLPTPARIDRINTNIVLGVTLNL